MSFKLKFWKAGKHSSRRFKGEALVEERGGEVGEEVFSLLVKLSKELGASLDLIELTKRLCFKFGEIKQRCSADDHSLKVYSKEAVEVGKSEWFNQLVSKLENLASQSAQLEDKGKEQKIYKRLMHLYFYTENPEKTLDYAIKRIKVLSLLKKEEDEQERIPEIIDKTIRFALEGIEDFWARKAISNTERLELLLTMASELQGLGISGGASALIKKKIEEAERSALLSERGPTKIF